MIDLAILIAIVIIAFFTGSWAEKRHTKNLRKREQTLIGKPFVTDSFTALEDDIRETRLVGGSCVIAADKFKMMLGGLRNFFGGNMAAFESLTERARREAILRMREEAPGADMIVQSRVQMCELGKGRVEALAYGTAIFLNK